MIVGMQKGFGVRPSQGTNLKLRALKQSLKDIKRGARELKSAQSKLRNFIRRSIPRGLYTKSEVTNLISKVTNSTKENLDNLIQEVVDKVTEIQVSNLETQIKYDEFTFIMNSRIIKDDEDMKIISRKIGNFL